MHSYLVKILEQKREEVKALRNGGLLEPESSVRHTPRDFKSAISREGRIGLIAEIKYASPSAGDICRNRDTIGTGRTYEKAGAAAISLVTDRMFFKGRSDDFPILKSAVTLPVLRKDFIIDEIQVKESYLLGADAILLIAAALSRETLTRCMEASTTLGMAVLTEVHDREDLQKAIDCGAPIIGINNRSLKTFEVSLDTTLALAPHAPQGSVLVSESGIRDERDISRLKEAGIGAILIGTELMKSANIFKRTRELIQGCNGGSG